MGQNIFEQRIRQLLAIDLNAEQIFLDLSRHVDDEGLKKQFSALAKDEARHVAISRRILELINQTK